MTSFVQTLYKMNMTSCTLNTRKIFNIGQLPAYPCNFSSAPHENRSEPKRRSEPRYRQVPRKEA